MKVRLSGSNGGGKEDVWDEEARRVLAMCHCVLEIRSRNLVFSAYRSGVESFRWRQSGGKYSEGIRL